MPPMLVTLSVRRAHDGDGPAVQGSAAAVFFLKLDPRHKLDAVRETLSRILGLPPGADLPLSLNGALLDTASHPTEAGLRTGSVVEAALDADSFERCMRSEHKGALVDLDDFQLSGSMSGLLSQ